MDSSAGVEESAIENESEGLEFNVLPDCPAGQDDHGAHTNIAKRILKLVHTPNIAGVNIGLEGLWGAGKSTVVRLLKNEIKKDSGIFYFYFDAWVHEKELLRRVFLEKLIHDALMGDKVKGDLAKELGGIEKMVTNKLVTKHSNRSAGITGVGFIAGLCGLLSVSGAIWARYLLPTVDLTYDPSLKLHWLFVVSVLMLFSPLIPLSCSYFRYRKIMAEGNDVKLKDGLFKGVEKVEYTTETMQESERSSVEFKKYFVRILEVLHRTGYKDILLVIDNLDRIDSEEALKLWSVLQIFVECPEDSGESKQELPLRVWSIVPYDVCALEKSLGEENGAGKVEAFLKKTFKMRIHVPRLGLRNWISVAQGLIEKSLTNFSAEDQVTVLNVLKWSRGSPCEVPTLRDIKSYINQIGLLYNLYEKFVPLESICYYAAIRYVDGMSDKRILDGVINGSFPKGHAMLFSGADSMRKCMCAILFAAPPQDAVIMLLSKTIAKGLSTCDVNALKKAKQLYGRDAIVVVDNVLGCQDKERLGYSWEAIDAIYAAFGAEVDSAVVNYVKNNSALLKAGLLQTNPECVARVLKQLEGEDRVVDDFVVVYENAMTEVFVGNRSADSINAASIKVFNDLLPEKCRRVGFSYGRLGCQGALNYFRSNGGSEEDARGVITFDVAGVGKDISECMKTVDVKLLSEGFFAMLKCAVMKCKEPVSPIISGVAQVVGKWPVGAIMRTFDILSSAELSDADLKQLDGVLTSSVILGEMGGSGGEGLKNHIAAHALLCVSDLRCYTRVIQQYQYQYQYRQIINGARAILNDWQSDNVQFLECVAGLLNNGAYCKSAWKVLREKIVRDSKGVILKSAISNKHINFLNTESPYDNYQWLVGKMDQDVIKKYFELYKDSSVLEDDAVRTASPFTLLDNLNAVEKFLENAGDQRYVGKLMDEFNALPHELWLKAMQSDDRFLPHIIKAISDCRLQGDEGFIGGQFLDAAKSVFDQVVDRKSTGNAAFLESLQIYRLAMLPTLRRAFDNYIITAGIQRGMDVNEKVESVVIEAFKNEYHERGSELSQKIVECAKSHDEGRMRLAAAIAKELSGRLHLTDEAKQVLSDRGNVGVEQK